MLAASVSSGSKRPANRRSEKLGEV